MIDIWIPFLLISKPFLFDELPWLRKICFLFQFGINFYEKTRCCQIFLKTSYSTVIFFRVRNHQNSIFLKAQNLLTIFTRKNPICWQLLDNRFLIKIHFWRPPGKCQKTVQNEAKFPYLNKKVLKWSKKCSKIDPKIVKIGLKMVQKGLKMV